MKTENKIKKIKELLLKDYPVVYTPLLHESSFQLLVATVLSAQTLDDNVNKVTPELFRKYPTAVELSQAKLDDVQSILKSINYYKTKSKNIIELSITIVNEYKNLTPNQIDELVKLPGVGRKTANVLISEWFAKPIDRRGHRFQIDQNDDFFIPRDKLLTGDNVIVEPQGFVVDTHIARVSKALGLTAHSDPKKIELDLMKIFLKHEWPEMSLRLLFHGRYRCTARKCKCGDHPEWKNLCNRKNF